AASTTTAAKQHDSVAANSSALSLHAVLVGVFVSLQSAFDVHLFAFHQIFGQRLRLFAPQVDVVPLGAFLPLSVLVVPRFGRGDAEFRHRRAAGGVAELRIAAEIAHQNDLVHTAHWESFVERIGLIRESCSCSPTMKTLTRRTRKYTSELRQSFKLCS